MVLFISSYHTKFLNGYVLLVVLIYLQLIALLTLAILQQEKNYMHSFAKSELMREQHQQLKDLLPTLNVDEYCSIATTNPKQITAQATNWWNRHACTLQTNLYQIQYVIEDLKTDVCAVIAKNKIAIANYYRITLRLTSAEANIASIMQAIIVKPTPMTGQVCQNNMHIVQPGVQFVTEFEGILQ